MRNSKYVYLLILYVNTMVIHGSNNNTTCSCYLMGSMSSIGGESMCNNNALQCKCYPNVVGKKCDKCATGFYDILSGRGCTSCNCNSLGSTSKSCNSLTGQCSCKDGFIGSRCDQCEPNTYRFAPEKCSRCSCNVQGSKNPQCNVVGLCSCLPNVEGKHCDRCKENTFNIKEGCIPCPPCYEFVKNESQNFREYLTRMEQAVEGIENNLPLYMQDHKHFLNELKLLKAKINKLKLDYDKSTVSEVSESALNDLIKKADDLNIDILKLIERFNNEYNYADITDQLYIGRNELKDAKSLVKICENALESATQTSKSLNRHNKTMTKLAEKALVVSEDIETKAEEFYQLSLNITSCCNDTCSTAEAFRKIQETQRDEIENVRMEFANSSNGAETVKSYLTGFLQETKKTKEESIRLETEVNKLRLPDTSEIEKDYRNAEGNFSKINNILANMEDELIDTKTKQKSTKKKLKTVQGKQEEIKRQFSIALTYENRANEAINKTNNILKSAQQSLTNLQEYERIKQSAQEALKEIPKIRAKIDAVLNNSEEIQNIIQELLNTIENIQRIQTNTNLLLKLIESNDAAFADNLKMLEAFEEEQKKISKDLAEHHRKLKRVKINLKEAKDFQDELQRYITGVEELIKVLNAIPLTDDQLVDAQKEIRIMEEMMDTVEYLTREKENLEREVQNVKAILEDLPINDVNLCEAAKSEPKLIGG